MPRGTGEKGHGASTCQSGVAAGMVRTHGILDRVSAAGQGDAEEGVTYPAHTHSVLHLTARPHRLTATARTSTPRSWAPLELIPPGRRSRVQRREQGDPLEPDLPGAATGVGGIPFSSRRPLLPAPPPALHRDAESFACDARHGRRPSVANGRNLDIVRAYGRLGTVRSMQGPTGRAACDGDERIHAWPSAASVGGSSCVR